MSFSGFIKRTLYWGGITYEEKKFDGFMRIWKQFFQIAGRVFLYNKGIWMNC